MLASVPFLPASGRLCPSSKRPRSMCVHAKVKTRKQQTSNGKKRCKEHMKRYKADKHNRHGEQGSKDTNKQVIRQISKIASRQAKRQTRKRANKRWCPWGTNVDLDWMSIASLCWSMDDTPASKTHAWTCKCVKMHRKPTGGTNKHGKHIIARSRKGERYAQSNWHRGDAS